MSNSVIQTYSGLMVDLLDPKPEDFAIEDIAHALSNICRFTGHTRAFYSVAQHCVIMSRHAWSVGESKEVQTLALMHDAAEAYIGDVSRPMKRAVPSIKILDRMISAAIFKRFGIAQDEASVKAVKLLDNRMLATEKRDVLACPAVPWPGELDTPFTNPIDELWAPERAVKMFMLRFEQLASVIQQEYSTP